MSTAPKARPEAPNALDKLKDQDTSDNSSSNLRKSAGLTTPEANHICKKMGAANPKSMNAFVGNEDCQIVDGNASRGKNAPEQNQDQTSHTVRGERQTETTVGTDTQYKVSANGKDLGHAKHLANASADQLEKRS